MVNLPRVEGDHLAVAVGVEGLEGRAHLRGEGERDAREGGAEGGLGDRLGRRVGAHGVAPPRVGEEPLDGGPVGLPELVEEPREVLGVARVARRGVEPAREVVDGDIRGPVQLDPMVRR